MYTLTFCKLQNNSLKFYQVLASLPTQPGITYASPSCFLTTQSTCLSYPYVVCMSTHQCECLPVLHLCTVRLYLCVPIAPSVAWFQSPMLPAACTAGPSTSPRRATCAYCIVGRPQHVDVTVRLYSELGQMAPQCITPPTCI